MNYPQYKKIGDCEYLLIDDWIINGYLVPAGLVFRGANVPKQMKWLVKRDGVLLVASIIHDYMYTRKIESRMTCDIVFFDVMRKSGVNLPLSIVAFLSVVIFGGKYYENTSKV